MGVADHVETLKAKDGARFIVEIKNDRLEGIHETATDHESVRSRQSLSRTSHLELCRYWGYGPVFIIIKMIIILL